jgi:hypothetical protein
MTSEESIPTESAADIPLKERTVAAVASIVCGCGGGNGNGKMDTLMIVVPGTASCPHCKFEYEARVKGRVGDGAPPSSNPEEGASGS